MVFKWTKQGSKTRIRSYKIKKSARQQQSLAFFIYLHKQIKFNQNEKSKRLHN